MFVLLSQRLSEAHPSPRHRWWSEGSGCLCLQCGCNPFAPLTCYRDVTGVFLGRWPWGPVCRVSPLGCWHQREDLQGAKPPSLRSSHIQLESVGRGRGRGRGAGKLGSVLRSRLAISPESTWQSLVGALPDVPLGRSSFPCLC